MSTISTMYCYDVPDVMCGGCAGTIERALRASPEFKHQLFQVDPIEKKLTLMLEDDQLNSIEIAGLLNDILEPCGFVVKPENKAPQPIRHRFSPDLSHRLLGGLGLGLGMLVMCLSWFAMPWPVVLTTAALSLGMTLLLGKESYQQAWKKWKTRTLTMDTLFTLSTLTMLGLSCASLLFPMMPMMFEVSLFILGFRHVGLAIEASFKSSRHVNARFQEACASTCFKREHGKIVEVALHDVKPGDELRLFRGDVLPVDGLSEADQGLVMDQIITGSNKPRRIVRGETLYAGTVLHHVFSEPFFLRVSRIAAQSHLAQLDRRITRAKLEKASLETTTNRILQYFIPAVVIIAILSGGLVGFFFSATLALQCVASVLVSACPCTLGLITPLAIKMGMKKAADHGVTFNSTKKLESAAKIDAVVFDLNGTLTQLLPSVVRYSALPGSELSDQALLNLAAHLEGDCTHPLAKAIVDKVRSSDIKTLDGQVTCLSEEQAGLVVEWKASRYTLGSEVCLLQQGVNKHALGALQQHMALGPFERAVYIARGSQLLGYIVLKDELRADAAAVIATLKQRGITPHICTGADQKTAERYALHLGISPEHVRANCVSHAKKGTLQSKKHYIDELKAKGYCVAAVGDADNDVEMIAASDVGLAMQSNSSGHHVQQEASAVIRGTSLLPIVAAILVAKETVTNMKHNLGFSLVYNVASLLLSGCLLAVCGMVLNPAVCAALMIAQTSFVLWNVARVEKRPLSLPQVDYQQDNSFNRYLKSMAPLLQQKPGLQPDSKMARQPAKHDTETSSLSPRMLPHESANHDTLKSSLCGM